MTRRGLAGRLERLERLGGGDAVDLDAEAAELGEPVWNTDGGRAYRAQRDGTGVITVVNGHARRLVYEVVGVDLAALM
jgi:hypothetical protein